MKTRLLYLLLFFPLLLRAQWQIIEEKYSHDNKPVYGLSKNGDPDIPAVFEQITKQSDGTFKGVLNGQSYIIDPALCSYEKFDLWPVIAQQNGRYGLIYSQDLVVPCEYDSYYFDHAADNQEYLALGKGDSISIFESEGGWKAITIRADKVLFDLYFFDEYFGIPFTLNGNKGMVSLEVPEQPTIAIQARTTFDKIHSYENLSTGPCYIITRKKKRGIIGPGILLEPLYDDLSFYHHDNHITLYNGKFVGLATYSGDIFLEAKYDGISLFEELYSTNDLPYLVKQKGKFGIISSEGKTILPTIYNSIEGTQVNDNKEYFLVRKKKYYGLCDLNGKIVIPAEYTELDLDGDPSGKKKGMWVPLKGL